VAREAVSSADLIKGQPTRPPRLANAVTEELVGLIVSGDFPEGSLLPPEPALCQSFGVSRVVVRESLRFLEQKGLVRVRHGQGSTVLSSDNWDLLDSTVLAAAVLHDDSHAILEEVVAIRVLLESHLASEAAVRRDDDALRSIGAILEQMDPANSDEFPERDRVFHELIVRASGNPVGNAVLRDIMREATMVQSYRGSPDRRQRELSLEGHKEIFNAIEARDGARAFQAMQAHIYESWVLRSGLNEKSAGERAPFVAVSTSLQRGRAQDADDQQGR
jgi:DNA-binding FadR family transcriptional regulator